MQSNRGWDQEVDLVVLGAGPAGMTAALVAVSLGLRPLLIEKTGQVGGTGATSAGTIWIPGNRASRDAGFKDSEREGAIYMDALIGAPDSDGLRAAYLSSGPEMVEYLHAHSEVRFLPSGKHPDYRDLPGSAVFGRALYPQMFDARLLGAEFERVRPPIPEFLLFGGMMAGKVDIPHLVGRFRSWRNFSHTARLVLRYLTDRLRFSRGTRLVMGNALIARLYLSLRKRDVPVMFDACVTELIMDTGRVSGVLVQSQGKTLRVLARKGVFLATGGFGRNPELRQKLMPQPVAPHSIAAPGNTGDGIRLGLQAGAMLDEDGQGPGAFWSPVSVTQRKDGTQGVYPHLLLDRAKPGLIAINSAGKRFVNEACSYHDFVLAMYASHEKVPTMPAYLICEAGFVAKYGLGNLYPGTTDLGAAEESGYLVTAQTISQLAERLGIDQSSMSETVKRYNALAREGKDLDFGKGDSELNRFNGDPDHGPNPCLAPIETGPFVALAVWPAEIGTSAGLRTNRDAQLLDANGNVIEGLYAIGNDMASIMAGTYPGPGTTIGPAMTFAYRAVMHAAGRPVPVRQLDGDTPAEM